MASVSSCNSLFAWVAASLDAMDEQAALAALKAGSPPLDLPHWGSCAGAGRWEAVHGFYADEDGTLVQRRCPCCTRPIECQPCVAVAKLMLQHLKAVAAEENKGKSDATAAEKNEGKSKNSKSKEVEVK